MSRSNTIEDEKLVIFGWITTVLGLPDKADPTKYNELTDKLYQLFEQEKLRASMVAMSDYIEVQLGWIEANEANLRVSEIIDTLKSQAEELQAQLERDTA